VHVGGGVGGGGGGGCSTLMRCGRRVGGVWRDGVRWGVRRGAPGGEVGAGRDVGTGRVCFIQRGWEQLCGKKSWLGLALTLFCCVLLGGGAQAGEPRRNFPFR